MPKRPAYTLLFLKSDLLARADFGPLPRLEPLGFWQQPQSGNVRLYYAMEAATEFGGKFGRDVWVIGEEFWTQTLSLPASAVQGLNQEQIRKAIAFDVEALTGIAGTDAAIGFCSAGPSDESAHYWVTQVPVPARAQIQTAVEAVGSELAGLVHPGGIPASVSSAAEPDDAPLWRRIEVWKDTTLCISGSQHQPRRITVINGDPAQDAWRTSVSRWMSANDAAVSEWLGPQGSMAGQSLGGAAAPWTPLPSLTGDVLKGWLTRWARDLTGGANQVPAVAPSRSTAFTRKHVLAAALIAVICLAACIARGEWLINKQSVASLEYTDAQAPSRQAADLRQKIGALRTELVKQREKAANGRKSVVYDPADVERQRFRVEGLLAILSQEADPNLVVERIAPDAAGAMLIEGKCFPSSSADNFSRRLAMELPARGWEITPAQKLVPAGSSIGGPCEFRLRVTPASATASKAPWSAGASIGGVTASIDLPGRGAGR